MSFKNSINIIIKKREAEHSNSVSLPKKMGSCQGINGPRYGHNFPSIESSLYPNELYQLSSKNWTSNNTTNTLSQCQVSQLPSNLYKVDTSMKADWNQQTSKNIPNLRNAGRALNHCCEVIHLMHRDVGSGLEQIKWCMWAGFPHGNTELASSHYLTAQHACWLLQANPEPNR